MPEIEVRVSIIIPIYNAARYLDECLDSISKQTLKEIEIICIDDGSTDNSAEIVRRYQNRDSRYILIGDSCVNRGQAYARNCGLRIAKGEYIYFLDADDLLATNEAMEMLWKTAKQKILDGVIFDSIGFYQTEGAKRLFQNDNRKYAVKSGIVCSGKELFSQAVLANGYTNVVWQQFWKRSFLEEHELFFVEDTFPWEDMLFSFCSFMSCDRMMHISKVLHKYRYQEDSSSTREYGLHHLRSHVRCYYESVKFLEKVKLPHCMIIPCTRFLASLRQLIKEKAVDLTKKNVDVLSMNLSSSSEKIFLQMLLTEEYSLLINPLTAKQYQMLQSASNVIVYGAGRVGHDVMRMLIHYGVNEFAFAVTKKGNEDTIYNTPVKEIGEFLACKDTSIILIAAGDQYREEMKKNLISLGFPHYICMT